MKILISREEVRIATEAHPDHEGIMLYIDTLLDTAKITKRALEMACEDADRECVFAWHDTCPFTDEPIFNDEGDCPFTDDNTEWKCWIEYYLTEARNKLKESDGDE